MLRLTTTILAFSLFAIQPALAEDTKDSNFAKYSLSGSFSPFGTSLNFGYNSCSKTSYQFSVGGFPETEAPFKVEVDDSEYTVKGSSSWAGVFVQHRPVDDSKWFRLVFGFGVGQIKNSLDDGEGNTYTANYTENPVIYSGIGFGGEAKKGFIWGFDIGLLSTAGPNVIQTSSMNGIDHTSDIEDFWAFGAMLPNAQLTLGYGF